MRDRRQAAGDVGGGHAARHRAVRGGGQRASQPRASPQAFRPLAGAGRALSNIVVANAPVSYGAFELTVGILPNVPDGAMVMDEVAAAGYAGIDLGPGGYLASKEQLGEELRRRNLRLAGGFHELPFSDPKAMQAALPGLDSLLDLFDAAHSAAGGLKPRPTLADLGSDARRARPAQAALDPSLGFDAEGWKRFAAGVEVALARCRERGY